MSGRKLARELRGIIVPIVTPFKDDCELDEDAIVTNIDFLLENGVTVIVPCGTNGEFSSLTIEERKRVVEATVRAVAGRVPVVAGTSHSCLKTVMDLTRHAQELGVDGVMMMPPYYLKPTEDEVYLFFSLVDREVDIPILLYNNPSTTKVNMSLDLMERLSTLRNVAAIKESNSEPVRYFHELVHFGNRLTVIPAGEPPMIYNLLTGAPGFITVSANFAPRLIKEIYEAAKAHDLERAFRAYGKLLQYRALFQDRVSAGYPAYITYAKAAMHLLGLPAGPVRPPLSPLSEGEITTLRSVLEEKLGLQCVA